MASPLWTPKKVAIDGSTRDISRPSQPVSSCPAGGRPSSPYASPMMPTFAIGSMIWNGNSALAQQSCATGRTCSVRNDLVATISSHSPGVSIDS